MNTGWLGKVSRPPAVAAALLVMASVAYFLWKRKRSAAATTRERRPGSRKEKQRIVASTLYRSLELALTQHGVTRLPATPPLRHAETLAKAEHPLASEVVALTMIYLEARFGSRELDDATKADFEARVRAVRAYVKPTVAA